MGMFTFKGGIHPYDGKDLSKDKPIRMVLPKGDLVYPLSQHIGAPATPVVAVGDRVLKGQKIGEAVGFVSANVHASVSGTVKLIESRLTVTGTMVNSVIIENDNKYEEVEYTKVKPLNELTKEEIRNLIKEAGIVGMGGAGFPTHVKLTPKDDNAIDFVIVNCAECEPYLTSDYRRMIEEPEKLVGGLKAVLRLFENAKGILAVEDNKPDCIQALNKLVKDEPNIKVVSLKTKYPQGAERQLIFASTGRAINSSMLPADAGCVVNNVDTVAAIYMAVFEGKPLMNRTVTITGEAINNPCNLMVCTGTIYRELIEEAGGFKEEPSKIISGGPMMGFAIYNIDVPVTKTSSALLCLTEDDVMTSKTTACINCGKCVEVCPGRIIPSRLADMANRHDEAGFIKLNGMECCACGCCSFICPAKRQLTQSIKSMRQLVLANVKKK
jgi:electron transport complex protein RnfC